MKLYKLLSWLFLLIVPNVIGFFAFYQGQEPKVAFSFSGIFILLFIFILLYNKFKEWHKTQKQAHETARNLGQTSHTVNFTLLGFANFFFMSVPFIVLSLLDGVLKSYQGNISLWVGYLLISIAISQFFDVVYYQTEQKRIKERLLNDTLAHNEKLAQTIKDKL